MSTQDVVSTIVEGFGIGAFKKLQNGGILWVVRQIIFVGDLGIENPILHAIVLWPA
jgi:hypothetical protein